MISLFHLVLRYMQKLHKKKNEIPSMRSREQGRREKQLHFLLHIKKKVFCEIWSSPQQLSQQNDSPLIERSQVQILVQTNIFFIIFIILYLKMLLLFKKRPVLYGKAINLIIYSLKVLISNIYLKKYHSTMRCGLDKKKTLKDDHNWFRLSIILVL